MTTKPPAPHETLREAILRRLLEVHQHALSPKSAGVGMRELAQALKPLGFKQHEVADQLDYLLQRGWVREVVEYRPFAGPAGAPPAVSPSYADPAEVLRDLRADALVAPLLP